MANRNSSFLAVLTFAMVSGKLSRSCYFNLRIRQTLRNDGFHRNLTYDVVFNADQERERWMFKDCVVALHQELPPGVYVNPDELDDLGRINRINAVVKNKVNIEQLAEDAQPNSVYVIGRVLASKVYLWLPVHARYHQARPGGGHTMMDLPPPACYLRCPDQRLAACAQNLTRATFLCNGSGHESCSWKLIPYMIMSKHITWRVPVGNTSHYYIVSTCTAAVIIIGSLYLLHTIHEYKLSERRKKLA